MGAVKQYGERSGCLFARDAPRGAAEFIGRTEVDGLPGVVRSEWPPCHGHAPHPKIWRYEETAGSDKLRVCLAGMWGRRGRVCSEPLAVPQRTRPRRARLSFRG